MKKMEKNMDIASLSASYLAGEMNRREENSFLRTIQEDKNKEKEFLLMKETWSKVSHDPLRDYSETGSAWNNLYSRLKEDGLVSEEQVRSYSLIPVFRIAAGILILIAVATSLYLYLDNDNNRLFNTINYEASNSNAAYDLPDGSRVFLKKGSELSLNESFEEDRSVSLEGEAFFDVMSDPERPFTIKTGNAEIVVLGTTFNVRQRDRQTTEVFVESGSVKVKAEKNDKELVLSPGQFSKITMEDASIETLENPNYLSWKTRVFHFDNLKLETVFSTLEDAYQIEIIAEHSDIDELRLSSTYKHQSVEAILKTIATALDLKIEKKKDKYLVEKNRE